MSQGPQTKRDLGARIKAIERTQLNALQKERPNRAVTSWEDMDLPLGQGWVPFGDPYSVPGFYKDSLGVVHLRGVMKNGDVGAFFSFDPGYLPEKRVIGKAFGAGLNLCRVDVLVDGTLTMVGFTDNSLISLDGIFWRASS